MNVTVLVHTLMQGAFLCLHLGKARGFFFYESIPGFHMKPDLKK